MLLAVWPVAAGLAAGFLAGGSLRRAGSIELRGLPLLAVSFAAQVLVAFASPPDSIRGPVVVASYAGVGAFLAVNVRRPERWLRAGFAALALGWALNVLPMALNGGMPVSAHGLRVAGVEASVGQDAGFFKHVEAGQGTRLAFLGDVIPLPAVSSVVSAGDLVLGAGVALSLAAAMRQGARPIRPSPALEAPSRAR